MALNPIAFTARVVEDFLRDQLTTYPLADTARYTLLDGQPTLTSAPTSSKPA